MQTIYTTLSFAGHHLHRIAFQPETFTDGDLLWLPHHDELAHAGKKRRTEHLAGRMAAAHALHYQGEKAIPGIGPQRQPLWPQGMFGSISHCANQALAVVSRQPVGVDIETLFSPQLAAEVATHIASPTEIFRLQTSGLPFAVALTLAFSAKESVYKAFSHQANPFPGFPAATVLALHEGTIRVQLTAAFSPALAGREVTLAWQINGEEALTLTVNDEQ